MTHRRPSPPRQQSVKLYAHEVAGPQLLRFDLLAVPGILLFAGAVRKA